jgi:hypothetical protein
MRAWIHRLDILLLRDLDGAELDLGAPSPGGGGAHMEAKAWRGSHDLLPLAHLVQWHRLLHDGTSGDGGSSTTAPTGYELFYFYFQKSIFYLSPFKELTP